MFSVAVDNPGARALWEWGLAEPFSVYWPEKEAAEAEARGRGPAESLCGPLAPVEDSVLLGRFPRGLQSCLQTNYCHGGPGRAGHFGRDSP